MSQKSYKNISNAQLYKLYVFNRRELDKFKTEEGYLYYDPEKEPLISPIMDRIDNIALELQRRGILELCSARRNPRRIGAFE